MTCPSAVSRPGTENRLSRDSPAPAVRAGSRSAGSWDRRPFVSASGTGKGPGPCRGEVPLDPKGPAVDESVRELSPRGLHDIAECLAGNAHHVRRIGLIHPFQVGETERFELVPSQEDFLETR
jgi:hypothetical protein